MDFKGLKGQIFAPTWLVNLTDHFRQKNFELYLVGGAIRDQILGQTVKEWDLTTNAKPLETEKLLRSFGAKNIGKIGARFGTVTAEFNGEKIEITTYRAEEYLTSSRQPEVSFGQTLEQDLQRRDFTVNALAYDPKTKEITDLFKGWEDLENKLIRAVGQADDRFREDPLRMIRAVRLAVQLDFEIEPKTLEAISLEKERLGILSAERISQELDKLLLANSPSRAIKHFVETGLISYILPELIPSIDLEFDPGDHKDIYQHILQVLDQTPAHLELRWCALLHDIAKPLTRKKIAGEYHFLGHENLGAKMTYQILGRLKYPTDFIKNVAKLVRLHQRIPGYDGTWSDGGVRRFVRDAGSVLTDLFDFAEADSTGKNERKLAEYHRLRQELKNRIEELEKQAEIAKIKSPLSGDELMKIFNRPAGVWIKPIKDHLLELVLDGELRPDNKAGAEKIARELIKNTSQKP